VRIIMEKAQILKALVEVYNNEFADDDPGAEGLSATIERAWQSGDIVLASLVAEIIERAVELLTDKVFLWHHDIEFEDYETCVPDGFYRFIAVDPETGTCLTFHKDVVWNNIAIRAEIKDLGQAIKAVEKLLDVVTANLKEG